MSEILFLIIGFLTGFGVCLFGYFHELDNMTAEELRAELDEINTLLKEGEQQRLQNEEDEMKLSPLDRAMDYPTHDE